jgi:hypothetical protein
MSRASNMVSKKLFCSVGFEKDAKGFTEIGTLAIPTHPEVDVGFGGTFEDDAGSSAHGCGFGGMEERM